MTTGLVDFELSQDPGVVDGLTRDKPVVPFCETLVDNKEANFDQNIS